MQFSVREDMYQGGSTYTPPPRYAIAILPQTMPCPFSCPERNELIRSSPQTYVARVWLRRGVTLARCWCQGGRDSRWVESGRE